MNPQFSDPRMPSTLVFELDAVRHWQAFIDRQAAESKSELVERDLQNGRCTAHAWMRRRVALRVTRFAGTDANAMRILQFDTVLVEGVISWRPERPVMLVRDGAANPVVTDVL